MIVRRPARSEQLFRRRLRVGADSAARRPIITGSRPTSAGPVFGDPLEAESNSLSIVTKVHIVLKRRRGRVTAEVAGGGSGVRHKITKTTYTKATTCRAIAVVENQFRLARGPDGAVEKYNFLSVISPLSCQFGSRRFQFGCRRRVNKTLFGSLRRFDDFAEHS
ncbi:hypothetical protein EVAR_6774_1 [Eumeta japonica]|uniref:Uncharacterized protein n=1 Tax=Eumeta variegata TaxID=151549 RepID=A0A4C1V4Y4_EUMVA|nr:hypothetical protein EVAR_6774_1 [Eumeta japonica]